jgi:hypothetical protein
MLLGILQASSKHEHKIYTAKRAKFTLPKNDKTTYADQLMNELKELVEQPTTINHQYRSWISENSWKIIDAKAEARRIGNMELIGKLKKELMI